METNKKIDVSLDEAIKWFNSGNATLRGIALQAFSRDELLYNYRDIKSLSNACEILGFDYVGITSMELSIARFSKSSAAMFKLNIIRKALNLGQDLYLTKNPKDSYIYYPYNPFVTKSSTYYNDDINLGKMKVIGKIKSKGEEYNVLCGRANNGCASLGNFDSYDGVGYASANAGFLGCANEEIAQHLGKYFGMLITEAKYGDMIDFEIVEDKYGNA